LWLQYQSWRWATRRINWRWKSLDGDMPSYVHQNNRDEFTHQNFLNA